jgi:hypothetical protein
MQLVAPTLCRFVTSFLESKVIDWDFFRWLEAATECQFDLAVGM